MKITIPVCNVCKDTSRPVTHYLIVREGVEVPGDLDLCEEHESNLLGLFDLPPPLSESKVAKKAIPKRTSRARLAVTSIEDIESMKVS